MIIDKVRPYWTEEDQQQLAHLQGELDRTVARIRAEREAGGTIPNADGLAQIQSLDTAIEALRGGVEARYIKATSKKAIMADVQEIVTAIEKADFLARREERLAQLATLRAEGATEESLAPLKKFTIENFENCYSYILYFLRVQLNAIADDEDSLDKVKAIIEKRVALWYVKPHPDFLPMAHGKATDALAFMNTRNAEVDRITGNATIDRFGVQLVILRLRELQATMGVNTDKLLSTAIAVFTQQNDFRHTKPEQLKREITIDLKEYAQLLGYDVEEHETSTPEEAEREKKRAKNQLDNARKAIKKDLDIIHASTLTWEEPIKGKARDYVRISLVELTGIRNGQIKIEFSQRIASYLAERNLITQYPTKLLGLDSRKPTAYYIGRKLAEHYNLDNNQIRGTHDRISIPALLAVTDLPSYEYVQQTDRGHWENRIKRFFEEALDTLTQEGILKNWEYVHAKGVPLTDEEAQNITSYEDFAQLYLHFTPADKVDHTERIQAKQEARAEARQKKRTTRKKKS